MIILEFKMHHVYSSRTSFFTIVQDSLQFGMGKCVVRDFSMLAKKGHVGGKRKTTMRTGSFDH